MRRLSCLIVFFLLLASFFVHAALVRGDELDDISKQLNDLNQALSQSKAATAPLESQVAGIKGRVAFIEQDIVNKRANIEKGYKDLEKQQDELNLAIRNYYIKSYYASPILVFLSSNSASTITQLLAYQKAAADQDKQIITNIALTILGLEQKKIDLEAEQVKLAAIKIKLDKIISDAKLYQSDLSGKIAALSAKQQEIINARSGTFTFSLSEGELADEYLSSIKGFRESAPGGYFSVFSFGGYTHRNGMSQYGARGRAESGQSVEEILSKYYPGTTLKKDFAATGNINVEGYGSMPFEDQYLQGIYEVPGTWHINVLKAQAIAARTYAIRYTSNGQGTICTTESCQVFKNSKKGGAWEQAVNETRNWVLVDGSGNPVSTQYASTHGGFSNTSGWDTTDGSGGSNFIDKSYDKIGGSPWLYKSWWRQGYSNQGNTCGRANPWLSPQEMADIVNTAIALRDSGGIDTGRITPVTTSCWSGNPYSMDELRNLTAGKGGISSATSVSVSQGNGSTSTVTINGVSISGADFKRAFNLRAPGYLSIPQSGFAFYNVEKK